jgi:hypothetical protein
MSAHGWWLADVIRPNGHVESTFHFTATGVALLVSGGVGAGTWTADDARCFCFRLVEPLFGDSGACAGWVEIEQHAVLGDDTFTGEGTSVVFDTGGSRLRVVRVVVSAKRISPPTP